MAEKKAHSRPPADDEGELPAKAETKSRKARGKFATGARDAAQASLAHCNAIAQAAAAERRERAAKVKAAEQAAIDKIYLDAGV